MSPRASTALLVAFTSLVLGAPDAAWAQDIPDTPAWRSNVGLVTGLGFAILVPDEGSTGVGAELSGRYGIVSGPIVIGPGGRLAAYHLQDRLVGILMPTLRLTAPLGPFAPYVHGGAGGGVLSNPGDGGLAWLGGGGLMIHFSSAFALGVEVDYQGITGTGFGALSIGPTLIIGG